MKKDVVLWTNIPSHHMIGPFRTLANSRKVHCVCREPISKFREGIWKTPELGAMEVVYLLEKDDPGAYIDEMLAKTQDAVHFISGFGDLPEMKLIWKRIKQTDLKPVILAERPNPQQNKLKACMRDLYYSYKIHSLAPKIGAILCMGKISVDDYRSYGLPEHKALVYMYTNGLPFPELTSTVEIGKPVRFVFVGRDSRWIKGLDVLVQALRGFSADQLAFDFIGPDKNSWLADFIKKNSSHDNIRLLGKFPSDEIATKLAQEYDVLVLSSRYDGWGMTVSEALLSGIAAIVTDKCGSQDVVEASGAGEVVMGGNEESLRAAIQSCVDDPQKVLAWKERARAYRDDLRPEKLASYLEAVIDYVEKGSQGVKPNAYWLKER